MEPDIEAEELAAWAHVLRDPHTHLPTLMTAEELHLTNEWIEDNIGGGVFLERSWIQPGPLAAPTGS